MSEHKGEPKEQDVLHEKKLSRREFLKTTGILAGTAAIGGTLLSACATEPAAPAAPESTAPTSSQEAGSQAETPAQGETPAAGAESISWDYEADVVIVGLGGAGACAAIEAHDAGAKVLILEKQEEATHFSNTRMSGGVFHNPDPSGDRAALKEYIKATMSGENIPWKLEGEQEHVSDDLAEMFTTGIMEVEDFLMTLAPDLDRDSMSPGGEASFPMFPGFEDGKYGRTVSCRYKDAVDADASIPIYERPRLTKTQGESFYWALVEEGIKDQRPDVEILYESPVKRLIQNPGNGEVIGVIATQNGADINVKAKRAVVLTCGGYEYSVPMRRAFLEGPGLKGWCFYGSPHNTGDGIEMAILAGAALAKVGKAASRIEAAFPHGINWETKGLKMGVNTSVTSSPNSLIVDNYGRRYANEHIITDSTQPYRYQFYKEAVHYDMLGMIYPRIPSWSIFDETRRTSGPVVSMTAATVGYGYVPWTPDNSDAIERGWILKADTLEELAELINADEENRELITPEQLRETVDRFNQFCANENDEDFNRSPSTMGPVDTPPYYAMKLYPGGPNTKGGLDADAQRHVLDWEGNPVPRLFSAGELSSVFKFTYQAGGNLTECIVCGRVAGKSAAAMSSWE